MTETQLNLFDPNPPSTDFGAIAGYVTRETAPDGCTRTCDKPGPPKFQALNGNLVPKAPTSGENFMANASQSLGIKDRDAAALMLSQLAAANFKVTADNCTSINGILGLFSELEPRNPLESLLFVQMVTCHNKIMALMGRLTKTDLPSHSDSYQRTLRLGDKLMTTFVKQLEAFSKFRRGGSQKMIVEHVHMAPGSQAIIGNQGVRGR